MSPIIEKQTLWRTRLRGVPLLSQPNVLEHRAQGGGRQIFDPAHRIRELGLDRLVQLGVLRFGDRALFQQEAAEAIEEFLGLALAYDREAAPSLQGFIAELRAGDLEVKRDMEQDRDEVRIMTVHGAKGLQAPIVFLPDTCQLPKPPGAR